jgi:hypothetical protein
MSKLKDFTKMLGVLSPLMENRDKAEIIKGETYTITDFDFVEKPDKKTGELKEFSVFITKEDKDNFYFGGLVLTKHLKEIEKAGLRNEVKKEGMPVSFEEVKPVGGNAYTKVNYL